MKNVKAALALLPAIKELDWQELALILLAARHYSTTAERTPLNATVVNATYPKDSSVILINLSNESLNGQIATVDDVFGRNVIVTVAGSKLRVDAECAVAVPAGTTGIKASVKPIGKHVVVRTLPGGKYGNRLGIVTAIAKSKVSLILVDDFTPLKAPFGGLVAAEHERPAPTPAIEVQFKVSPFGAGANDLGEIFIVDTSVHKGSLDPDAPVKVDGVRKIGYHTRDDGRAYANFIGAKFLEI